MITTVTYNPKETFGVFHNHQQKTRSINHSHPSVKKILPKLKTMEIHKLISLIAVYEFEIDQFKRYLENYSYSDITRVGIYTAYRQDRKALKIIKSVYRQRVAEYLSTDSHKKSPKDKKHGKTVETQKEKGRVDLPENTYGTYFSTPEVKTPYTLPNTEYVTKENV